MMTDEQLIENLRARMWACDCEAAAFRIEELLARVAELEAASKIRPEFDHLYADTPGLFSLVSEEEFRQSMGVSLRDCHSSRIKNHDPDPCSYRMRVTDLIAVATGEIEHAVNGLCPDRIEGFDSRDPDCPACKILIEADGRVAEMEAERAQAEGYVTALRYIAWEAAGYMDCVHAAKRAIGEMGALPPPPKIQPAKNGD